MGKAIIVRNLSKSFFIREKKVESLLTFVNSLFQKRSRIKEIKAVQNFNFDVEQGEFFGIIGMNGSGKSTLLNLLMGSYKPNDGSHIEMNGKIVRLALGMGFDKNLSARDNIYLNGSVIGLSFKEIGSKFNTIIKFSELSEFVDTPLKYFSSGMLSRLAFSIAIHLKADILLIDEFFGGVGDESFKHKSESIFENTFFSGRTIIFVSHDLAKIRKFCNRVLLVSEGKQIHIGPAEETVEMYKELVAQKTMTDE